MNSVILGQVIKLIAVGAKGALLIAVVPYMMPGEYSAYFTAITLALLAGRIGGFAAEEQIVLSAKGSRTRWQYFVRTGISFHCLTAIIAIVVAILNVDGTIFLSLFAAFGLITSCYFTGVLRIKLPLAIEISGGLPWTIATVGALLTTPKHASELMWILGISYFLSNTVLLFLVKKKLSIHVLTPNFRAFTYLAHRHRDWREKIASNMLLAVNLRVLPLGAEILGKSSALVDAAALAFSIGEVCYQLVMVRVNRLFTARVLHREDFSIKDVLQELKFTAVTVAQAGAGLYLLSKINLVYPVFGKHVLLNIVAAAYCGSVALFCFYRLHIWSESRQSSDTSILCFQAVIIASSLILLILIDDLRIVAALSIFITVSLFLGFSMRAIERIKRMKIREIVGAY